MSKETLVSIFKWLAIVSGFLLGAATLGVLPFWQVAVWGWVGAGVGLISLLLLLAIAFATGPTVFLGMTLCGMVLHLVMIFTGTWAGNADIALRKQGNVLVEMPRPTDSFGYMYPGWWNDDIVVADNVRDVIALETNLPQVGVLNPLKLEVRYLWSPETYGDDLLAGRHLDYRIFTDDLLRRSLSETLATYDGTPFTDSELRSMHSDVETNFCNKVAMQYPSKPCPQLQITLTYSRDGVTTVIKPR